jgi:trk system potassium uptake protein TrkH
LKYKEIFKIISKFLFYFSLILLLPLFVAIYYEYVGISMHPNSTFAFIKTIFVTLVLAIIFYFLGKKASGVFYRRESILIVVILWFLFSILSALPFYFSNTLQSPIDCFFEATSGITTTGSTVMCPKLYSGNQEIEYRTTNPRFSDVKYNFYGTINPVKDKSGKIVYTGVEAVSKAVLFWRSFIQWLGGIGIVVLFLTVLPALAIGGKFLLHAEMTGPVKDSLAPRIKETSILLLKLYVCLTIIEIVVLILTNENIKVLDAFCITFSNLSTGGFSIRNDSIASYNSFLTEWIIIIFMFIGCINFGLYFHALKGKFYKIYEPDFLLYLFVIIIGSAFVVYDLIGHKSFNLDGKEAGVYNFSRALRSGTFHAISAQTSTGFVTTNVAKWPFMSQIIMMMLMYFGGMPGSTAGGIKTSRFYILFKILKHKMQEIFRPNIIRKLKVGARTIESSTITTVLTFFIVAIIISIIAIILHIYNGIDLETSISCVACNVNNVGFAFGVADPINSFAFMQPFSKILSAILMLLGRLEYFTILLIFMPSFWKVR